MALALFLRPARGRPGSCRRYRVHRSNSAIVRANRAVHKIVNFGQITIDKPVCSIVSQIMRHIKNFYLMSFLRQKMSLFFCQIFNITMLEISRVLKCFSDLQTRLHSWNRKIKYNSNVRNTCTNASSPKAEQLKVGVVPRKPESVTSSTVSPILSTSVAFTKDTMMYASYSSAIKITRLILSTQGNARTKTSKKN